MAAREMGGLSLYDALVLCVWGFKTCVPPANPNFS
jgi:hypothetical protein